MLDWIENVFSFIGPGGFLVGVTWFGKELYSNYSKGKLINKQANIEHDYFRKRLQYEAKYEVYKDIYQKAKILQGTFYTFDAKKFNYNFTGYQEKALTHYAMYSSDTEIKKDKMKRLYESDKDSRYILNFSLSLQEIRDAKKEFNNVVSANDLLYDEVETKKLLEIERYTNILIKNIEKKGEYIDLENPSNNYYDFRNQFNQKYNDLSKKLDKMINDYKNIAKDKLFM